MYGIGLQELAILLLIAMLLFAVRMLPELALRFAEHVARFDQRAHVQVQDVLRELVAFGSWSLLGLVAIVAVYALGLDETTRDLGRALGTWLGVRW